MNISALRYLPPMGDESTTHLTTTLDPTQTLCGTAFDAHRPHALPAPVDGDPQRRTDDYAGRVQDWIDERDDLCDGCREVYRRRFTDDDDSAGRDDDPDPDADGDDDRPECRYPSCSRPARGEGGFSGRFCSDGCEVAFEHNRHDAREAARDAACEAREADHGRR